MRLSPLSQLLALPSSTSFYIFFLTNSCHLIFFLWLFMISLLPANCRSYIQGNVNSDSIQSFFPVMSRNKLACLRLWGLSNLYMSHIKAKLLKFNPMWFLEGQNLITFFLNQLSSLTKAGIRFIASGPNICCQKSFSLSFFPMNLKSNPQFFFSASDSLIILHCLILTVY